MSDGPPRDQAANQQNGTDGQPGRVLAAYSFGCFGAALVLSLIFWGRSVGTGGDMTGAGAALMLMGMIHLLALTGCALGFIGRRGNARAQLALWMNTLLLAAFWTWGLFFSRY